MAGSIVLRSGDWDVSSGGFRAMAEGVCCYLGDDATQRKIRNELSEASQSGLYIVDASDFTDEALAAFLLALQQHIAETERSEKGDFPNPELYDGYLARLLELLRLLRNDLRDREKIT